MPNTIADNLQRLVDARAAIASAITAKGGTVSAGDGLEEFSADIATITNQYTAQDEGKVVSNGALVAQTAYPSTITNNGTYDTTENNSVTVNVISSGKFTRLYSTAELTTHVNASLGIDGNNITLSGFLSIRGTEKKYYIDYNDITLSDYINSNVQYDNVRGLTSVGAVYLVCVLNPSDNSISYRNQINSTYDTYFYKTNTL